MLAGRLMVRSVLPVMGIATIGSSHFQTGKDQALIDAIAAGSLGKVQEALRDGSNPNASIAGGENSPLLFAIARRGTDPKARLDIIEMLLAAGADPAKQQKDGFDALIISAFNKDADLCGRFCGMGVSPMRCAGNGVSAFHTAATLGDVTSLKAMLPFIKADQIDSPTTSNGYAVSALYIACLAGHLETATWLLEHHANPNFQDSRGSTPLLISASMGSVDLVNLLIKHGARVDLPFADGLTPLGAASFEGRLEVARTLIAHGADINHQNKSGLTAMMDAAAKGHTDVVELLLKAGARPDIRDKKGRTAADYAKAHKSGATGPAPESTGG